MTLKAALRGVARLIGIECGVVSRVVNLESSSVEALDWRPGHDEQRSLIHRSPQPKAVDLFDNWFDPIETEVRARAREFIEGMIRGELDTVLARSPGPKRHRMAAERQLRWEGSEARNKRFPLYPSYNRRHRRSPHQILKAFSRAFD
jgi:hypothetical protein